MYGPARRIVSREGKQIDQKEAGRLEGLISTSPGFETNVVTTSAGEPKIAHPGLTMAPARKFQLFISLRDALAGGPDGQTIPRNWHEPTERLRGAS